MKNQIEFWVKEIEQRLDKIEEGNLLNTDVYREAIRRLPRLPEEGQIYVLSEVAKLVREALETREVQSN